MKKQNKLVLILAGLLSLGIGFTACFNDNDSNSSIDDSTESSSSTNPSINKFNVTVNECDGVDVVCDALVEQNGSLQFTVELLRGYEGELTIAATVGGVEVDVMSGIGGFYVISGVTGDVIITVTGAKLIDAGTSEEPESSEEPETSEEPESSEEPETSEEPESSEEPETSEEPEIPETVAIMISTNDDGIILPNITSAEVGQDLEFDFTLEEGYQKKDFWVKANGVDVAYNEEKGKYVIENVDSYLDIVVGGTEVISYTMSFTGDVDGAMETEEKTYGYFDNQVIFNIPLSEHYTQSELTVTYTAGEESGTLTADETGYYTLPNLKMDVQINVTGITLNVYKVDFLLNGESKYSVDVEALSSLTSEQLETAQTEVVSGTAYSFVKWVEDTSAIIVSETSFNAEVMWGETVAENAIRTTKYVTAEKDEQTSAPVGYTTVYKGVWTNDSNGEPRKLAKDGFADVNVIAYAQISFAVKGNTWLIDDTWSVSYDLTKDWTEITLDKVEGTAWNITFKQGESVVTKTGNGEMLQGILHNYWAQPIDGVSAPYELYATEIRGVKDVNYQVVQPTDSNFGMVIPTATEVTDVKAPIGYEKVYQASASDWSSELIDGYAKLNFKILTNDWHLYDGWNKCQLLYKWVEVSLVHTENTWTVTISDNGKVCHEFTKDGSSIREVLNKYSIAPADVELVSKLYVTELRGEALPPPPAYGVEIVGVGVAGMEAAQKVVPGGFEKAYYMEDVAAGTNFADVDISSYGEVRFYLSLTGGYFTVKGWGAYAQNAEFLGAWKLVQLVNNGAGSWTITINAKIAGANVEPYVYTATGTTLKEVLDTWFDDVGGADVYLTEIRGVALPPVEMYGTKIVDKAIDGFAESTAKAIPEGFEKVYYLENVAAGVTFADVDISAYEEVRFYLSLTGGYFAIKGWGAYAQNAEFLDAWKLVQLVNNGDGTWTVTVNAKIAGANVEPYSYTATGTTLKAVLSTWFEFSDGADVYLTEVRAK